MHKTSEHTKPQATQKPFSKVKIYDMSSVHEMQRVDSSELEEYPINSVFLNMLKPMMGVATHDRIISCRVNFHIATLTIHHHFNMVALPILSPFTA